jgi:hypothetical protein
MAPVSLFIRQGEPPFALPHTGSLEMRHLKTVAAHAIVSALLFASPCLQAQEISGSWLIDTPGFTASVAFLADGRYVEASIATGDPAHTGLEWGTYSWNESTGAITAQSLGDSNGNWGLAADVNGTRYFSVSGNTATMLQAGCAACTNTLSRILPGASPIVGSWLLSDAGRGLLSTTALLADGRYIDASIVAGDSAHTGIEWGTYNWNASTGEIAAHAVGDFSGDWGLAGDASGAQYIAVSGNSATIYQPGCADCTASLIRILPMAAVPEATNISMLILGLGLLSFLAYRRKSAQMPFSDSMVSTARFCGGNAAERAFAP